MPKLIDVLGFTDNPFAHYVAENEPEIENYFIRPPYYDSVTERGTASRSLIVFGARGAGKSATRITFYKSIWAEPVSSKKLPLVITLDDFSRIAVGKLEKIDLSSYVSEIGYLVVEAALLWLSTLPDEDRNTYLSGLTQDEEALVLTLVEKFYLSRPEILRSATVREPLKLLNQG